MAAAPPPEFNGSSSATSRSGDVRRSGAVNVAGMFAKSNNMPVMVAAAAAVVVALLMRRK